MVGQALVSWPQSWSAACSPCRSCESVWADSSNATTQKSPSRRRSSASIFSMVLSSARRACDQPGAQERADLALAPPHLGGVEQVLAQHLRAELARREGKHDDADERQEEVVH